MYLGYENNQYEVVKLVARAPVSNFYTCEKGGKQFLLQIARDIENNPRLDFAAYTLMDLQERAELYEQKFREKFPGKQLDYNLLIPQVENVFRAKDQGGRIASILSIKGLTDLDNLVPLSNIREKNKLIIDLATSVWIMGRMLRLLVFAHDQNVSISLAGDNILIEPNMHRVVALDWSNSTLYQDGIPEAVRSKDISCAARAILMAIGEYENVGRYRDTEYVSLLCRLLNSKNGGDAKLAYEEFEETHSKFLDRNTFYEFTTFQLTAR